MLYSVTGTKTACTHIHNTNICPKRDRGYRCIILKCATATKQIG